MWPQRIDYILLALCAVGLLMLGAAMVARADGMMGSTGRVGSVGAPSDGGGAAPGGGFAITTETGDPLTTESSSILVTENAP